MYVVRRVCDDCGRRGARLVHGGELAGLVLCRECREARSEEMWEVWERECGREWVAAQAEAACEAGVQG